MEECICAIDQGTQSTRVILFDKRARVVAKHQRQLEQHNPRAGWVEHDPTEILQSVEECIAGALEAAEDNKKEKVKVVAIGITNQRETTLVWDSKTGKPFHNAIVWFDSRTSTICHGFTKKLGSSDYFRPLTGLPISTYFSAYKFRWLVENVNGIEKAIAEDTCFLGTVDTWLIWNLTGGTAGGVFVTDVSNASRTNFMELATQQWHDQTLELFGVKRNMLADIKSNAEVYGKMAKGPLKGIPISGCLGDQQSALLGQACKEGEAKNTYGTGCFMLLNTGTQSLQSNHGLISTVAFKLGQQAEVQFALEGSIAVAGAGVRWLQDSLGAIDSPEESEKVASSVPDSAGVIFVPAFSGLLAPHWRDDARGVILGITSYTKAAHIVRAMLEAVAWQTKEVLDAMKDDAKAVEVLKVDGGASNNNLLMQMQADTIQLLVRRPEMLETTSLGAAYAAGIGIGFWSTQWILDDSKKEHLQHVEFKPEMEEGLVAARFHKWQKAVQRSLGLADLTDE